MPSSNIKTNQSIDYFGELSWANFWDWLVTLCLGAIIFLTAMQLGGVRPETQLLLQPLYIALLFLHGLSLAASKGQMRRVYLVPLLFLPFLLWALASVLFWTPTPWRGAFEISHFFTAFIFCWVAVNNVRTRTHLGVLILIAIVPLGPAIFNGFYQFFQNPDRLVLVVLDYPIELSARYRGDATGLFADPGSFAAFLILLLPGFTIAAFAQRLPIILRVFGFYVALFLAVGIALSQTYWAVASVVLILLIVPWFCFESKKRCFLFSLLGGAAALTVGIAMFNFNPQFERGLARAMTAEGEGVRLLLWEEALGILQHSPISGSGAGSFSYMTEHSADFALGKTPFTPHNDFLHILSTYGLVGGCLLFLPLIYTLYRGLGQWLRAPFKTKTQDKHQMSSQKFYLAISFCSALAALCCACFHFTIYVPALILYGLLLSSTLVKLSFRRLVPLPDSPIWGATYILICLVLGFVFYAHSSLAIQSHGLELQARQRLEDLVVGGSGRLRSEKSLDEIILLYEDALIADRSNADAWIGLSMAICQLHYSDPGNFKSTGAQAAAAASQAYQIAPGYWLSSAQMGVALALSGEIEAARQALERALQLAPNSSNAHYYYAAFLSDEPDRRAQALEIIQRALSINPSNEAARRLEQKLLIL